MIAALYVQRDGCYSGLPGVDPWPEERDARTYAGPWPVVCHSPCARWGRYYWGGPTITRLGREPLAKGDDDGCFAAALASVRRWGGVLEHPAQSHAWLAHGLPWPAAKGWQQDISGGWCCRVEQGAYGHKARKATWLYAVGTDLPTLRWGRAAGEFLPMDDGYHSAEERRRAVKTGACQRLSHKARAATPPEFRDLLLSIVATARQPVECAA